MRMLNTIDIGPEPMSPLGMTPSALALSADHKHLFVACSDANAVAVVDVSETLGTVEGFLSGGAYPTAVAPTQVTWVIPKAVNGDAALDASGALVAGGKSNTIMSAYVGEARALPGLQRQAQAHAEHVIYMIHETAPEALMSAIAGLAPDFTVKMARFAKFDLGDPANAPPAGYLWTNALAAGMTVQNYGVFMKNGQAIDQAMRQYSDSDVKNFFQDLKEGEASGDMPRLIIMQVADQATEDAVTEAVKKSKFAAGTEIVNDLARAEALLGLRPMTRRDAIRP